MSAARLTGEAHQFGASLQRTRIELHPAHRVVDVLHGGGIRVLVARAEIERNRDDAVPGHGFMAQALGGAVAQTPGTTVAFDQRRERPLPSWPENTGEQRLVAVAEVLDVLHVEFMGLDVEGCSRHGKPSVSQGRPSVIIAHDTDDGNPSARKPWRHPYPRRFRETVLANSFQGRRLNRPNDVVVKSDGAIYFTDPRPQRTGGISRTRNFSAIARRRTRSNAQEWQNSNAKDAHTR